MRRAQAREAVGAWQEAVRDYSKVQELDASLPGIADKLKHAQLELKKANRVDYYKVPLAAHSCACCAAFSSAGVELLHLAWLAYAGLSCMAAAQ